MDQKKIDEIIDKYAGEEGVLIQLLLDVQKELNWIPQGSYRADKREAPDSDKSDIPGSQLL